MLTNTPDILTVRQLAEILRIGRNAAYTLLKTNQIRHVRVGRKYLIPKQAVIDFFKSSCYTESG
jgi:excisionase family DNA binding protein